MATLKTDLASKQDSNSPKLRASGFLAAGTVSRVSATYIATGAEVAGDIIDIADLPAGAQILPGRGTIATDGVGGTGATIATIGDAGSAARYSSTAVAVVAAGVTAITPANAVAVAPYTVEAGNTRIKAVIGLTSGSLTAGKKSRFELIFSAPGV